MPMIDPSTSPVQSGPLVRTSISSTGVLEIVLSRPRVHNASITRCRLYCLRRLKRVAQKLSGEPLKLARQRTREQLRRVQIIFQNPFEAFTPRQTVRSAIARPLQLLRGSSATPFRPRWTGCYSWFDYPSAFSDATQARCQAANASGSELPQPSRPIPTW